jgi:predicted TIM-barrel fold metal-dependent hydrolase
MPTRSPRSTSSRSWGADYFVVSTDYPHPDGAFPEAMKEFLALPLDDAARRKILWDNCARLYDIPELAAPLTRAAPLAAAQ